MKRIPKVSIILPVYNSELYLQEALESISSQTYKDFEVVAVDDGSTDNSLKLLTKFSQRDSRVKVFRIKHSGMAGVLNFAIKKSQGQFIARMDSDDLMSPERIKKQVAFLEKNTDVAIVGTWMKEINIKGEIIGERKLPTKHEDIYHMMFYVMGLQTPSVLINRALIPDDFNWYRPGCLVEDLDLYLRVVHFGKFANLPEFLMSYRVRSDSATFKSTKKNFKDALEVRKRALIYYNYRPHFRSFMYHCLSQAVLKVIPQNQVVNTYNLFRRFSALGIPSRSSLSNV